MTCQELENILLERRPSTILEARKEELIELIPEFRDTCGFDQKSKWHSLDVFDHTMRVVDSVESNYYVRLAALFHDIGKPGTFSVDENGEGHFYGHWLESEEIFKKYQDQFSLTEEDTYLVRNLILYHDLSVNPSNYHLFLSNFSVDDLKLLFSLKKGDICAYNPRYIEGQLQKLSTDWNNFQDAFGFKTLDIESDENESEKSLILAVLCKEIENFSFKRKSDDEYFSVGIQTPAGICSFQVPMIYWNYFDIPEVYNLPSNQTKMLNIEKLKSLLDDNKVYVKK